jgi:uncharacterized protein
MQQDRTGNDDFPAGAKRAILDALSAERPVVIGIIGVSGVGKSSLVNSLFRTDFPISPTIACTKEFTTAEVRLRTSRGPAKGNAISLRVVDAPGLGESKSADPHYLEEYRRHLPGCDAIMWISAARNRAVALEQEYLTQLQSFLPRMVFGLGQADLVDPLDWDDRINLPSRVQEDHLLEISRDRAEKFSAVTGTKIEFIPFSAKRAYNLQLVFTGLVKRAQRERGWLLSSIKGFDFDSWLTSEAREILAGGTSSASGRPLAGENQPTGIRRLLGGRAARNAPGGSE